VSGRRRRSRRASASAVFCGKSARLVVKAASHRAPEIASAAHYCQSNELLYDVFLLRRAVTSGLAAPVSPNETRTAQPAE